MAQSSSDSLAGDRILSSIQIRNANSMFCRMYCHRSVTCPNRWRLESWECRGKIASTNINLHNANDSIASYTHSNTAYFGFLELCQPKAGDTVVVSGAAGAVGSLVGQIAKAKGCRVVGLAGNDDKCAWLKELGFDHAINYKTTDVSKALRDAAPDGYDCYFDNVGGDISAAIIAQMRLFGRIAVCGAISSYNSDPDQLPMVPTQPSFVFKQLKMEGFVVFRWASKWLEGITAMHELVQSGKVQYQETRTKGFENMPKAFIGMLRGENTGKALVEV